MTETDPTVWQFGKPGGDLGSGAFPAAAVEALRPSEDTGVAVLCLPGREVSVAQRPPGGRPALEVGRSVLSLVSGRDVPTGELLFDPELVIRSTTAPPPAGN
ncbi:hypothetical protein ACFWNC_05075 [Streptomyces sp. NPDC058369]|uniref:hypothetical protein n=1 Tax=unclassified Streptomyces TaxID=2593676 RepID=UPI0033A1C98A